jgi:hypothetical protein
VSVSTPAEIQSFIAERKKRYPTLARVAEKRALQEKRRQEAEERRKKSVERRQQESKKNRKKNKRDKPASGPGTNVNPSADSNGAVVKVLSKEEEQEKQRRRLAKHLRKVEKLQSLLAQSQASGGDEAEAGAEADDAPAGSKLPLLEEDDGPSSPDSSSSTESDSGQDSDAAPDVEPSKGRTKPIRVQTGPKQEGRANTNVPCKYFVRDGHCLRKQCRFLHKMPEKSSDKMTLLDRVCVV